VQKQIAQGWQLITCYEASPFGYTLHRQLTALGVTNYVIRPTLAQEPAPVIGHVASAQQNDMEKKLRHRLPSSWRAVRAQVKIFRRRWLRADDGAGGVCKLFLPVDEGCRRKLRGKLATKARLTGIGCVSFAGGISFRCRRF
jgi:hypothetical protein